MTYNVFSGTLNPTHFTSLLTSLIINVTNYTEINTHNSSDY